MVGAFSMKNLLFFPICLLSCIQVWGQPMPSDILVVDHGISPEKQAGGVPVGRAKGAGFVGDHFKIGGIGEVWIIDTIRTWAKSSAGQTTLGDAFESVTLFGGIEAMPPTPGQPPEPECDCHNLMTIQVARLAPGPDQPGTVAAPGTRQIDFRNLHWSAPGGVNLQFGVMGLGRANNQAWYNHGVRMDEPHSLKLFDEHGKFDGPYTGEEAEMGLNVQVWAHKSAPVAIRSAAATIEVVLHTDRTFDAAKADPASLRFGPKKAAPVASRLETVDGVPALVAKFRRADAGIQGGAVVSACLAGFQKDGIPFEGCDLIATK
jgi:hypothetical protein